MEGFKDEDIYSKTIDYIYPTDKIRLEDIKTFFSESGLSVDDNILNAMKKFYGDPLTKAKMKEKDLQTTFDSNLIKTFITNNYKDNNDNTNIEKLYGIINKIDSSISETDLASFLKDNKLHAINSFSDYVISIIPK